MSLLWPLQMAHLSNHFYQCLWRHHQAVTRKTVWGMRKRIYFLWSRKVWPHLRTLSFRKDRWSPLLLFGRDQSHRMQMRLYPQEVSSIAGCCELSRLQDSAEPTSFGAGGYVPWFPWITTTSKQLSRPPVDGRGLAEAGRQAGKETEEKCCGANVFLLFPFIIGNLDHCLSLPKGLEQCSQQSWLASHKWALFLSF